LEKRAETKKSEERQLKQFLRERNLSRAYTTYKNISHKRKFTVEHVFSNYEGTSRRDKIIVLREKGVVKVYDFNTMHVIGRRKGSINDAMKSLGIRAKTGDSFTHKKWRVLSEVRHEQFQLKNVHVEKSYNKILNRTRTILMTNERVNKFGFAVIDATYISADGTKKRVQARSHGGFNLAKKAERHKAVEDALQNGSAVAEFSPAEVIVNDYWFEVWTDKYG